MTADIRTAAQREAGSKSGFRDRISLARLAYAKLRATTPDLPEQPPPLFEAGFTLGMVMSGFREEQEGEECPL